VGGSVTQGFFTVKSANKEIKMKLAEKYIEQIRNSNYEKSSQIAAEVVEKLREFQNTIDIGLEKEIQGIRDQVNSILAEKQKGQANVEQKLNQLQQIENNMNEMDSKLDEFITQVTLG